MTGNPAGELREAARLMRERAAKVPAPWGLIQGTIYPLAEDTWVISNSGVTEWAQYLFSMHPGVALALADWLEATAKEADRHLYLAASDGSDADPDWLCYRCGCYLAGEREDDRCHCWTGALAVARSYLGTDAR